MTNHWNDLANSDCILIMGSNPAENHPISFKWVLKAQDKGAKVVSVDPRFTHSSSKADFYVQLRVGTDIAFLGGMINYILNNDKYFKQYVIDSTNGPTVVGEQFGFSDGLFSGFNADKKSYDKKTWAFEMDANGVPVRDETLTHPRCVLQLLKKHYDRYTLDKVSETTGTPKEDLLRVYETFASTGAPDKAGTIMYAMGWTQKSVGVQNIRAMSIIQLLLGNIGVAGGGVNALRGESNVQGSTDQALLADIWPGYLPVPTSTLTTLADYNATTPKTNDPKSVNWWGNRPKYFASLLKGWYGEEAKPENDFCYGLLPKGEPGADYSYMYVMDKMYQGKIKGGFVFGVNPMNSFPNTNKMRKALDNLDWMVCAELHNSETTDNWHRPGVDPKKMKTEVFLLPSAHRVEKAGTISNSGRWLLWFDKAVEPAGEARNFADMFVPLINKLRELYKAEGGKLPEALLKMNWPEKYDPEEWTRRINGFFWADTKIGNRLYKKGDLVPAFGNLQADGSTSSLNWLYTGSYTEDEGNKSQRRDPTQTPMQAAIGLYPNWSWCWPVNRRILYNRASVDLNGKPYNPKKAVIEWDGKKWVGDVPDGPWAPQADTKNGKLAYIMTTDGYAQLYGPGRLDGPFPEHYEPAETPVAQHPFSKQLSSPVYKFHTSDMDKLAKAADPKYPIVLTTYSMTEHWCGGGETRNVPNLLEAEPQLYVEMSPELAKEKGIANGDGVIVESARGRVEAIAMVTVRIRPFKVMGKTVHLIGMPFAYGWTTPKCGDSTNRLTIVACDPNTTIPEAKACCVNIRKADKLTEIA